jgi:hypothetical protein
MSGEKSDHFAQFAPHSANRVFPSECDRSECWMRSCNVKMAVDLRPGIPMLALRSPRLMASCARANRTPRGATIARSEPARTRCASWRFSRIVANVG